jgi:hypothetical protein
MARLTHGPGRPRKYGRAARAVTITLPEDVLSRLATVHADLGRAIVTLAERKRAPRTRAMRPAEVAAYGNHAVIVVNPAKALRRLPGVQLVPLGNGRALISLEPQYSVAQLELDVRDAIDRTDIKSPERVTLQAISSILRQARRSRQVSVEPRTIIVLERKRQRRSNGR